MKNKKKKLSRIFHSDITLKIASVFFAILLWSYVLSSGDTELEKNIKSVPIITRGTETLEEQNLIIINDNESNLASADVKVSVPFNDYYGLDKDAIALNIDYSNLRNKGKHKLQVNYTTQIGRVLSVSPSTIEVEVDVLKEISVPVQTQYVGALPDDLYKSTPKLIPEILELRGPEAEVVKVSQAVCYINLTNATSNINDAMNVVLMDKEGEVVDQSDFDQLGKIPSVIVSMDIMPKKTVPLNIDSAIKDPTKIQSGYERLNIQSSIWTAEIAGTQEQLDEITSLNIEPISLQNAKESIIANLKIVEPTNGAIIVSNDVVQLYIEIAEKTSSQTIDRIPIRVEGLGKGLSATLGVERATIEASGSLSELKSLTRNSIDLYVDVTDMKAGAASLLEIKTKLPDSATGVDYKLSPSSITVSIKKR